MTMTQNQAQKILQSLTGGLEDLMILRYLWSGVWVIAPKKGKLGPVLNYLSHGEVCSGFELEQNFRALVSPLIGDLPWDTARDNNGVPGIFLYLGTGNVNLFLLKTRRRSNA